MTAGSIGKWLVKEGDKFEAGTSFCEVETDKASVSFDATDEGFVAKILVPAGAGEIKCGDPIMVTVEDAADLAAFKDFSAAASAVPSSKPAATPAPAAVEVKAAAPPTAPVASMDDRVFASPLAKKVLRESGKQVIFSFPCDCMLSSLIFSRYL